jgi:sulfur carrier protein
MSRPTCLKVNGRERSVEADTVERVLHELGYAGAGGGIAVARNGQVVPRPRWPTERVADGDELEVVGAVQGG